MVQEGFENRRVNTRAFAAFRRKMTEPEAEPIAPDSPKGNTTSTSTTRTPTDTTRKAFLKRTFAKIWDEQQYIESYSTMASSVGLPIAVRVDVLLLVPDFGEGAFQKRLPCRIC